MDFNINQINLFTTFLPLPSQPEGEKRKRDEERIDIICKFIQLLSIHLDLIDSTAHFGLPVTDYATLLRIIPQSQRRDNGNGGKRETRRQKPEVVRG